MAAIALVLLSFSNAILIIALLRGYERRRLKHVVKSTDGKLIVTPSGVYSVAPPAEGAGVWDNSDEALYQREVNAKHGPQPGGISW